MSESQVFYLLERNGETNKARWSIDPRGPSDFGHLRSFKASKQAFCVFRNSTVIFGTRFYGDPTVGSSSRLFHWTLEILRTFLGKSRWIGETRNLRVFTDRPVSVRLSYLIYLSTSNNSFVQFSGKDTAGPSGTAGQQ